MTFAPLLQAPSVVQWHTYASLAALLLGLWQFWQPKRGSWHRLLGMTWMALMFVVAISSLGIHALKVWGLYSPIHVLSVVTLLAVPLSFWAARHKQWARHKRINLFLMIGLVAAGVFTLLPGRILHHVVFGF